jgi:hypothetical protein
VGFAIDARSAHPQPGAAVSHQSNNHVAGPIGQD